MKIGVDASCWGNRRGFGRFTRELLTALAAIDERNQYWFFVDQQTARVSEFPQNVNVIEVETHVPPAEAASATGRRSLTDVWKMSNAVAKHFLDLFFFPAIYSYFPLRNRVKLAITIHDMTPARFSRSIFPNQKLKFFWNLKERIALWQADRIVTVSEYSKQQIVQYRGVSPSLISIVSEAAGDAFRVVSDSQERGKILYKFGLTESDRYLLYVGGISPHKNLQLLAKVFKKLVEKPSFSDYKLVLAGDFEKDSFYSDYPALQKTFEQLQLQRSIIFTGYVEDFELAYLYNSALLFVFPSLQEGFGLPAVEAMACGTPIVASNAGSLPEIIGNAGEFFDPSDQEGSLAAICRVLQDEDLRAEMRRKGLERAKRFSWKQAAQQSLDVFDSMVTS